MPCELIIQVKGFLIQCFNFLALPDISNNLQCCFCIGLALFKPGARLPKAGTTGLLKLLLSRKSVCVSVCVSPPPWLLKTIHVK